MTTEYTKPIKSHTKLQATKANHDLRIITEWTYSQWD